MAAPAAGVGFDVEVEYSQVLATSCAGCGWLAIAAPSPAAADYPEKPIRLLLPFPAGGAVAGRAVGDRKDGGGARRPFVIENKAGAGGDDRDRRDAKAAPDGHDLLTTPNHTINAAIHPKLPYDTDKDLVPISVVAEVPELLVSHPAAPFTNFAGFVDYAKSNPGKLKRLGRQRRRCRT
jgi:tripartite-type tricarboxylate transporter receptor subunit TctC